MSENNVKEEAIVVRDEQTQDIQEKLDRMGLNQESIITYVDLVLIIDATRSMTPVLDMVKKAAVNFHGGMINALQKAGRKVVSLRVKVIWFRDFYCDGDQAYGESDFFDLPEENEQFQEFVNSITAAGGGDIPETSLEALTLAMRSKFTQEGCKRRHVLALFTDAPAHPFEEYDMLVEKALKEGCQPKMYPKDMPKTIEDFYRLFSEDNQAGQEALDAGRLSSKDMRLVLFAPDAYPWTDMAMELESVFRKDIEPDKGGIELDMSTVNAFIAYSASV